MGYDNESPAYLVYIKESGIVKKVRCVKFTDKFDHPDTDEPDESIVYDYVQWKSDVSGGISQNEPVIATQSVTQNTNVNDGVHTQNASNSETTRRYPKRDTCRPKGLNDYVLENDSVNVAVHYCYTMHDIPTTYSEVVSSPKS